MPAWVLWLIAAGALAIAETLSVDFVLLMIAGGALAGAGAAALGAPAALQVAVFAVAAVGLVTVVRPLAKRRLTIAPAQRIGLETLIGSSAVVTETVDQHGGRVKLSGEIWSAQPYDPNQVLELGRTVRVMEIRGASAVVWAAEP
jgi:membrane protein implicated in regulation of membrane protease activity